MVQEWNGQGCVMCPDTSSFKGKTIVKIEKLRGKKKVHEKLKQLGAKWAAMAVTATTVSPWWWLSPPRILFVFALWLHLDSS